MSEKSLAVSRRDFWKVASIGATVVALELTGCGPAIRALTPPLVIQPTQPPLPNSPSTLLPPSSPPSSGEIQTVTPQPDVWKVSRAQRVELMAQPEFFTEKLGENKKKIITLQFDDNEYADMSGVLFKNNNCGEATLATIWKLFDYLNTGIIPDITIATIHKILAGATFLDIKNHITKYIESDGQMNFGGFAEALKLMIPEHIFAVEPLTPQYGNAYSRIVPQSHLQKTLNRAQTICEEGGIAVIRCIKYGGTHIILATDVKNDGTATIVDSYSGKAQRVVLKDYFELALDTDPTDPNTINFGLQPGFLDMIGITPVLDS